MTNALDSKIGINPSHLMSLGLLTIVSSLLEHALSAAIWRLSGMDGFDGIIISKASLSGSAMIYRKAVV